MEVHVARTHVYTGKEGITIFKLSDRFDYLCPTPSQRLMSMLVAILFMASHSSYVQSQDEPLAPNAEYSPAEVVEIVIDALQTNSEADGDQGIATVFRFASPKNRAVTGPINRFTNMIKRGFPDMLNHSGARFEPIEISGNIAVQTVWLYTVTGTEVGYAFQIGRQSGGDHDGLWMTDAVIPLGESPNSGTSI